MSPNSVGPTPAINRRAVAAVAALLTLVGGVVFVVNKQTPTGESNMRNIQCWKTSSGGQKGCITETGELHLSGSVVANGVTLGAGGSSVNTGAILNAGNDRFVNASGDTMTGNLLVQNKSVFASTFSGTTVKILGSASGRSLHFERDMTGSGRFILEGTGSIAHYSSGAMLSIIPQGTTANTATKAALTVTNTLNKNTGLYVYSDQANQNAPMVQIWADNVSNPVEALKITHDGTGGGAAHMTLYGPQPQVEMIETDQASPEGKFEHGVSADLYYVAGRNAADNAFEKVLEVCRKAETGCGMTILDDTSSQDVDMLRLQNDGAFAAARPGLSWFNSAGAITAARLSADVGASFQASNFYVQVADSAGDLQDRMRIDVDGNMALGDFDPTTLIEARGIMSGTTVYATRSFSGAGLTSCSNGTTSKLLWNSTTGRFSCGTDTDTNTTYTAGKGLTLTSTSFKVNDVFTGSLVSVSGTLASSGTLVWEGQGSGAALYIGGTLEGVGLTDCDADDQTLSWDATTKRFGCGDDDSGAGGTTYTAGQGLSLNGANAFSLNATITGSSLAVTGNVSASGAIHTESGAHIDGDTFNVQADTDQVGIGTLPAADLHILDNDTRTEIILDNTAADGDPLINFRLPGTAQWLMGIDDSDSDKFKINNGSSLSTASEFVLMQTGNVGIGKETPVTKFEVAGAISGASLTISGNASMTGSLLVKGNIATKGVFSGAALNIMGVNSYILGSLRIGDSAAPKAKLDVVGTISGSSVLSVTAVSPAHMAAQVFGSGSSVGTGSGWVRMTIPSTMSGFNIVALEANVTTAGTTNSTCFNITNKSKASRKVFSTAPCIETAEKNTLTGVVGVVNASNDDVSGGDELWFDVNSRSTTAPKGLGYVLILRKP